MSIQEDVVRFGYARVPPFDAQQTQEIVTYLKQCQVYPGCHVTYSATGPAGPWESHLEADVVSWHLHDVIRAPHLLECAITFVDAASEYLGTDDPLLYSMNAFCTRPVSHVRPDIQDWHSDKDDVRFLPMFTYLTDVGEAEAQRLRGPAGEVSIQGPAGTVFFSNTMLEHLGGKPTQGERIVTWSRWCVTDPPPAYVWDRLSPIDKSLLGGRFPKDERLRRAIRLIAS